MSRAEVVGREGSMEFLRLPALSEKFKYSVKASLGVMISFLFPFYMGWPQASTAVVTVILIAAAGPVGASVYKGILRVLGTILGAVVGMVLIALFPQDREIYLFAVSIVVTLLLYLARAYRGDMTIFMLGAITVMVVFRNGDADSVFLYGVDRTLMTIFAIVVYTAIGIFLWPVSVEDDSIDRLQKAGDLHKEIYSRTIKSDIPEETLVEEMGKVTKELSVIPDRVGNTGDRFSLDSEGRRRIVFEYETITRSLILLLRRRKKCEIERIGEYIDGFDRLDESILSLFDTISRSLKKREVKVDMPPLPEISYNRDVFNSLSPLQRASLVSMVEEMVSIYRSLRTIVSLMDGGRDEMKRGPGVDSGGGFLWFDIEHIKGSLITFAVFWTTTAMWISLNPPGGFMVVTMATGLSVLTTFSPARPYMLIIAYTFSFIFAIFSYIVILPTLYDWWEVGIFLFIYSFFGFYLFSTEMAIFFLMGILTFGLSNEMNFAFDIFLNTLLVFYIFLFSLLFFDYFPFSSRPEKLFLIMKRRFYRLAGYILENILDRRGRRESFFSRLVLRYARIHLPVTLDKMSYYAGTIDYRYFDSIQREDIDAFIKSARDMYDNLLLFDRAIEDGKYGSVVEEFERLYPETVLKNLKIEDFSFRGEKGGDDESSSNVSLRLGVEKRVEMFLSERDSHRLDDSVVAGLYGFLNLARDLYDSIKENRDRASSIDFEILKESRF
jgi:hypothetical protein